MRLIITLSRSGLRCVTACILTKETVGSEQNLRSGQCEPCFPEIKQRMPSLANSDLPFFNQLLVAGPDKRLCIIEAAAANRSLCHKGSWTACDDKGPWATRCNHPRSEQCRRVDSRSCQVYWRD